MSDLATPRRTSSISYTFVFPDGAGKQFLVTVDYGTLAAVRDPLPSYPAWTALEYRKCPNCPLREDEHPRCPVAVNLVEVVEFFRDCRSFDEVDVRVHTQGREYQKRTSLQEAISALMGVLMVTSGCPVMDKLRPMVDTHLPFMSPEESTYRMIGMYLTAQYFRMRHGLEPDWQLKHLVAMLKECRITNSAFCRRLQSLGVRDASLNALAILNHMGEITSFSVETDDFQRWERIFMAHHGGGQAHDP